MSYSSNPTRDDYDDSEYNYDSETDILTEINGSRSYDGEGTYLGHDD